MAFTMDTEDRPKSLSIIPPPLIPAEATRAVTKTVRRTNAIANRFNFSSISNSKEILNALQKPPGLQESGNSSGSCIFIEPLGTKGDVNRKSSVGSGVSRGLSASTAADGEWSFERLQEVGSDQTSEVGTVGSNEECQATNNSPTGPHLFFVKLLVSNQLAGMLIGTSGQEIKALKEKTGIKVVLSPHGRYFPGTAERLVVLEGTQEKVLEAMEWIVNKVIEQPPAEVAGATKPACRICVPRAVIGSLIGKNGSYIQNVRTTTGAHVHVSPLFVSADEACAERIVTIQSRDLESLRSATFTVLTKINEHPSNATCRNISYLRKPEYSLDYDPSSPENLPKSATERFAESPQDMNRSNGPFNCENKPPVTSIAMRANNCISSEAFCSALHRANTAESFQRTLNVLSQTALPAQSSPSSSSKAATLVLGPPPGLSGCNYRKSLTVTRTNWDNVCKTNVKYVTENMARLYNREVSAKTELPQCSLNVNYKALLSAMNNNNMQKNFKTQLNAKSSAETLASGANGVACNKRAEALLQNKRSAFLQSCIFKTEVNKLSEEDEKKSKLKEGVFVNQVHCVEIEAGEDKGSGSIVGWLLDCRTIRLSKVIKGWGVTITAAFIYYLVSACSHE